MWAYRRWLRSAFGGVVGLAIVAAVAAQPPTELPPPIPPSPPSFPGALSPPAAPLPVVVEQPGSPISPSVPAPPYRPLPSAESLFAPTVTAERALPPAVTVVPPGPPSAPVVPPSAPPAVVIPPALPPALPTPPAPPSVPVSAPATADPVLPPPEIPLIPPPEAPTGFYPLSVLPMPTLLPPLAPTAQPPATGVPGLPGTGGTAGTTTGVGGVPCDPWTPRRAGHRRLVDSLHCDDDYGLKSLFDSLHPADSKGKHWYDKLSIRGYTQFRYGRTVDQDIDRADPFLVVDRAINGNAENFSIRRARMIFFGDVSEHLFFYWQHDFAITLPGSSNTYFGQLRDLYGDVYIDKTKIHRVRVGLSKVPFGWENLQSSQNRVPLDRTAPMNSAVSFNERDLGAFYYWTPVEKQKLFKELVDGGLKGTGNYGIFALGLYNGQGLSLIEQNLNPHVVSRVTWPVQLANGQVVEASLQGYTGDFVVSGAPIRPLGVGDSFTPAGTGGNKGFRDQRLAASFVWYPQPFGFQAEWEVGQGPALNDAQTAVGVRSLNGGYVMAMYKYDTCRRGIITPYARYQYFRGGYKSVANAPFGTLHECDLGVEWQIRKEMELTLEYSFINGPNLNALDRDGARSYREFNGGVLRAQFQINY